MSTKTMENCPKCGGGSFPIDTAVAVEITGPTPIPMRQWRYECAKPDCGWTWATLAQRQHNEQVYRKLYRMARAGLYGG